MYSHLLTHLQNVRTCYNSEEKEENEGQRKTDAVSTSKRYLNLTVYKNP